MEEAITFEETIELCAIDGVMFSHTFFPKTARQGSPKFHYDMWEPFDNPLYRLISMQIFRGGAKTSILRLYTAKRIAYGLSHTILYVGKSEGHAIRSVQWLRNAVDYNNRFCRTFKLRRGDKWAGNEAQIYHGADEYPVTVMAAGIEGAIRGINVDDYRPDLIVLDDVIADENAATEDQRDKHEDLILGAVKESLAPASEAPDAKMVMLNTPQHKDDASCKTEHDPEWFFMRQGCWTKDTENLPVELQESAWPERWPSEVLRAEKKAALARNKSSVFAREKECKLVDRETLAFKSDWLKYYKEAPEYGTRVLVIDPVPKPTKKQIEEGMKKKDWEVHMVVQRSGSRYFCLEYAMNKGHDPSWSIATMFTLAVRYKVRKIIVESVAYQSTLAWLFEQEMRRRGVYFQIDEFEDRRSKYDRIVDSLNGPASFHEVYVKETQTELVSQFRDYPSVSHDDVLECLAIGVADLSKALILEGDYTIDGEEEEEIPSLGDYRSAP